MSNVLDKLEKQSHQACFDRLKKIDRPSMLGEVNNQLDCVILLKQLNDAIHLMWKLSDEYYTTHIFNSGETQDGQLMAKGYDDKYFIDLAERFEQLRMILYGNNLDWDELYEKMYDELLVQETYNHAFYEGLFVDVLRQKDKLQREVDQLKKETKQKRNEDE